MARQTQQLQEAVDDYIRYRKSMDISKGTIKQDIHTLQRFIAVNGNIWVHALNSTHVTRFFEEAGKTKQPQSLRNDHTRLAMFFAWARHTRRMANDNDPLWGRRKPRRVNKEKQRIHVSKFGALLDAAERRSPRDRAALALLLYTLGRDGEITDLRIRDVGLDAGYLMYRVHKNKTEDRMPICAELDAELRRWLTIYTEDAGFLEPNYFLVPARDTVPEFDESGKVCGAIHKRYAPERRIPALGKIVTPALEDIGFPTRDAQGRGMGEGAHTVRRSGARALFDALSDGGVDFALRIVQTMLHHANLVTTQVYIGLDPDKRTRDDLIRGQRLYPQGDNVRQLRGQDGSEDRGVSGL